MILIRVKPKFASAMLLGESVQIPKKSTKRCYDFHKNKHFSDEDEFLGHVVFWTFSSIRRHPVDILIRNFNIACFTMYTARSRSDIGHLTAQTTLGQLTFESLSEIARLCPSSCLRYIHILLLGKTYSLFPYIWAIP